MQERSRTKYTILGMLTFEKMSGYEITKAIKESTHFFWSESEGQVYPALAQCVKEEWVTCTEQVAARSPNAKKVYSITTKGREVLSNWLKRDVQPQSIRNELLLKIFFGNNVDDDDIVRHILQKQQKLEIVLNQYRSIRDELKHKYQQSPHLKYWLITLNSGVLSVEAELEWCKHSLKMLYSK